MPTFGSLFAGIGGFDLGLERAGWECAWRVEIDPHCQSILERHWPDVDRYGDVRTFAALLEEDGLFRGESAVDLVCGGFPCQDVSVAGLRAGLVGERSGLWREFHRVLARLSPRWVLIENVPGLLTSNEGADMAVVLGGLAELGYGWAYRVLDSQYFGLAQRRERVFIVGRLGDAARAAQVLLEPQSCDRDPPPIRTPREDTSRTFGQSVAGTLLGITGGSRTTDLDGHGAYVNEPLTFVKSRRAQSSEDVETWIEADVANTLNAFDTGDARATAVIVTPPIAATLSAASNPNSNAPARRREDDANLALIDGRVRRLTPVECERLQGFPDGWTEGESDSARYRMLGNAVSVPVAEWIGRRMLAQDINRATP